MTDDSGSRLNTGAVFLVTLAAFIIVVAGMRAASPLLVPFFLAIFIAIIASPPLFFLQGRGVPKWLAMLIVLSVIMAAITILTTLVGKSINDFSVSIPATTQRLSLQMEQFINWFHEHGITLPQSLSEDILNPGAAMKFVGQLFSSLSSIFTNAFLILMTVVFILLEATGLPVKIERIATNPDQSINTFHKFLEDMNRYFSLKTILSLATGTAVALWLKIIGVDYPLLWGLLAFLLNFIPNIGSIIAAIPAVLLALVQGGAQLALLTGGGYLFVNILIGNIIEPQVMGRGLGLSTLVVFISMIFWGWVLGPVGMLLSVPLTMVIKVALEAHEDTAKIAILLGSASDAKTDELPAPTE